MKGLLDTIDEVLEGKRLVSTHLPFVPQRNETVFSKLSLNANARLRKDNERNSEIQEHVAVVVKSIRSRAVLNEPHKLDANESGDARRRGRYCRHDFASDLLGVHAVGRLDRVHDSAEV